MAAQRERASLDSVKRTTVLFASIVAFSCVAFGMFTASRSPIFTVQVVELADLPEDAPVQSQEIHHLANIPVGKTSLFSLDLNNVEKRVLSNPWIKEVHLIKQLPQTLSISVKFREPKALIQLKGGAVAYVDPEGKVFGRVNLMTHSDLPLLSGFDRENESRIVGALKILSSWEESPVSKTAQVSSLSWDDDRGYRALVTYSAYSSPSPNAKKPTPTAAVRVRTMVDLGPEIDEHLPIQLQRVSRVLSYLSERSIASSQIWADSGKKIVVRTAHGS